MPHKLKYYNAAADTFVLKNREDTQQDRTEQ